MATKEENNGESVETKTEETPDNSTTEDTPTSLETIPEGTAARNGTQTAPKDKAKSITSNLLSQLDFTNV